MGRGGTRCCCCCRHRSPAFVRTRPPSFTFTRSHSPTPVHPLPFAHSRSRSPALPNSRLVCACSVIRSFSLHVASVCTRLCPLGCVSVCADPRYPVALVWPSFGLRSRSFALVCARLLVCSYMRISAILLHSFGLHLAFVRLRLAFVRAHSCSASCLCLYQVHN